MSEASWLRNLLFPLCGLLVAFVPFVHAGSESQFTIGSIIRGFELPQTDENGNIKSRIRGKHALIVSDNEIRITGLTIEIYNQDIINTTITSPQCTFWRLENKLTTDDIVEIKRPDLNIVAKGMEWELTQSKGLFRNNVQVIVQSQFKMEVP